MKYIRSETYNADAINRRIMGPNPIKLDEELLTDHRIAPGALVMDLGCGQGVTSLFLVKEYGFRVFATDLWIDPTDNQRFFEAMGLTPDEVVPIYADANALPYAREFFDAVICTDAYHYFGMDPDYLGAKLLPFVKRGGHLYIAVPGMKRDCHDHLSEELLRSWTPEDLATIRDMAYWTDLIQKTEGIKILSIHEMHSNEEVWNDWLATDNPYAVGDRKAAEAGGLKYFNFIAIVLERL